ncbi:MAG: transcription termination/antitermination NusG family protein, partial [Marmoricola sp.]
MSEQYEKPADQPVEETDEVLTDPETGETVTLQSTVELADDLDVDPDAEPDADQDADAAADEATDGATDEPAGDDADADVTDVDAAAVDPLEEFRTALREKEGDWFVVHTYSGMENRVKANLENRITSLNMEHYIHE